MHKDRCSTLNEKGERCKKPAEFCGMCMFHFIKRVHKEKKYREKVKGVIKECLEEE